MHWPIGIATDHVFFRPHHSQLVGLNSAAMLVVLAVCTMFGSSWAQPTLTLDWTDARELQDLGVAEAPAGCRCLEDSRPCAAFECDCTCDLQAGVCDAGCCCDSDCPSDVTAASRRLSDCLPEGAGNNSLLTCVSVAERASDGSSVFADINARRGLAVTPADESLAQGATAGGSFSRILCVAVVNSPSLGFYFEGEHMLCDECPLQAVC